MLKEEVGTLVLNRRRALGRECLAWTFQTFLRSWPVGAEAWAERETWKCLEVPEGGQ